MMKIYYYYGRDEDNRPMQTVCLMDDNGAVSKGVAWCSKKDTPIKSLGRLIAIQRAKRAMVTNQNRMDKGGKFLKEAAPHETVWSLTPFEDRILGR